MICNDYVMPVDDFIEQRTILGVHKGCYDELMREFDGEDFLRALKR
jgi:hypothetical protein